MPVSKSAGDSVFGATINIDGALTVEITRVGQQSALSRIIKLVEDAQINKAPIQAFADKISGIFAPVVVSISCITFFVWILLTTQGAIPKEWYVDGASDLVMTLMFAISVLVISCP